MSFHFNADRHLRGTHELTAGMYSASAIVNEGRLSNGTPAVSLSVSNGCGRSTSVYTRDPELLREIARCLYVAAQMLEEANAQ